MTNIYKEKLNPLPLGMKRSSKGEIIMFADNIEEVTCDSNELENKEDTTKYPLVYNSDYYVVMANELINSRQKLTLRESQLIAIAISQIMKEDKELKSYVTTIPELASFMKVSPDNLYRDIEEICAGLMSRVIIVKSKSEKGKERWKMFHWVSQAEYSNSVLKLTISDHLKPYLLGLEKFYTQTVLGTLMNFKTYYATRLFQYLKSFYNMNGKNEWYLTCEKIREIFDTYERDRKGNIKKELYKQNRDLIDRTIKPALTELSESDYVYVCNYTEVTERKAGQRGKPSLAGVKFTVLFFENCEQKEIYIRHKTEMENYLGKEMVDFSKEK